MYVSLLPSSVVRKRQPHCLLRCLFFFFFLRPSKPPACLRACVLPCRLHAPHYCNNRYDLRDPSVFEAYCTDTARLLAASKDEHASFFLRATTHAAELEAQFAAVQDACSQSSTNTEAVLKQQRERCGLLRACCWPAFLRACARVCVCVRSCVCVCVRACRKDAHTSRECSRPASSVARVKICVCVTACDCVVERVRACVCA